MSGDFTVKLHVHDDTPVNVRRFDANERHTTFAILWIGDETTAINLFLHNADDVERLITALDEAHAFLAAGVKAELGKCPRCGRDAARCAEDDLCGEKDDYRDVPTEPGGLSHNAMVGKVAPPPGFAS